MVRVRSRVQSSSSAPELISLTICYFSVNIYKFMNKKLYRSETDKQIAGICGGFAQYADIDSGVVRAAYVLITVFSGIGPGILAYLILAAVIPVEPKGKKSNGKKDK